MDNNDILSRHLNEVRAGSFQSELVGFGEGLSGWFKSFYLG